MALAVQEYITNHAATTNTAASGFVSLAVGDLMISHFTADTSGGVVSPPASWTEVVKTTGTGLGSQIAYKVADSGDVSGNTFSFTWSTAANVTLSIARITGHRNLNIIPVSSGTGSASSTDVVSGTITPALADNLIMLFATSAGTRTCSGYAIATSTPSFTETYDYSAAAPSSAMAWGLRPQVTATGSASATLSGASVNIGQLISVSPAQDFTVSETVNLTDTFTGNLTILLLEVLAITDSFTSTISRLWTKLSRNVKTWTNQNKD